MNERTWSAACVAATFAFSAALIAQSPPPSQPPPSSSSKAGTVTVTGCIERANSAGTTGTSGTAGASAGGFILANATMGSSSATSSPTTPPAAAGTSMSKGSQYRLDADDAKLSPHVGHKVEVTGTVEPSSSAPPAAAGTATGSSAANAPKLKVDSVKMVSASCS